MENRFILLIAIALALLILGVGYFTSRNTTDVRKAAQSAQKTTHNLCKLAQAAQNVRAVEEKVWGDFEIRVKVSLRAAKPPPGQTREQTLDTLRQIGRLKRAFGVARAADARLANC